MTDAGRKRLSEALLNMGRSLFELGAAVERLDEPDVKATGLAARMMPKMEIEVRGRPIRAKRQGARR